MVISEVKGDLFTSNDSLAHCVSMDFEMGKGIAKIFKDKFQGVDELKKQNPSVGGISYLEKEEGKRFIFYLVTKEKYWQKPTLFSLSNSLLQMKKICLEKGIKSLSMPKIGCGLDKLNWDDVKKILEFIFKGSEINITIYSF